MTCPTCGTENAEGRSSAAECGTPLARARRAAARTTPDEKFCGECGRRAPRGAQVAAPTTHGATHRRAARRLRPLRRPRRLHRRLGGPRLRGGARAPLPLLRHGPRAIERYGGTVEKFIGDAVMAVWGAPIAHEDDAERAVRAALDLVAAGPGCSATSRPLRARAGGLTGEAAVTIGAEGQGMVAGDLVNTASRVQSPPSRARCSSARRPAARPRRRSPTRTAGEHELKGKAEPVPAWRRCASSPGGGGGRSASALEAPFVGRERELRLVKDLFHATADESAAHLVSMTGIAGIGKSRLAWEFYKYFDGLVETRLLAPRPLPRLRRGRRLLGARRHGPHALPDRRGRGPRVRARQAPSDARAAHRRSRGARVPRAAARALLGLAEHKARTSEDLFAAWRLFFERLAEQYPTVLAFEDMQWADTSLLDFVEYLLEWSRDHPIFVVDARAARARRAPPGLGRRAAQLHARCTSSRSRSEAMDALLDGLVPGLPAELRDRDPRPRRRHPLYAVETVRMLLDRGLLVRGRARLPRHRRDRGARGTRDAARADRGPARRPLEAEERGCSRTRRPRQDVHARGAGGARGRDEPSSSRCSTSLVRKEVLGVQSDPALAGARAVRLPAGARPARRLRDASRGESGRRASRGRRVSRAARVSTSTRSPRSSHRTTSTHSAADEDAHDAAEIQAHAPETARASAGERAASLGAPEEAQRYFERPPSSPTTGVRARSLERARGDGGACGHRRPTRAAAHAGDRDCTRGGR